MAGVLKEREINHLIRPERALAVAGVDWGSWRHVLRGGDLPLSGLLQASSRRSPKGRVLIWGPFASSLKPMLFLPSVFGSICSTLRLLELSQTHICRCDKGHGETNHALLYTVDICRYVDFKHAGLIPGKIVITK